MNKKTTFTEVYEAFIRYCKQPKTRWDIKEYGKGFIIVFGILILINAIAVVLTASN